MRFRMKSKSLAMSDKEIVQENEGDTKQYRILSTNH